MALKVIRSLIQDQVRVIVQVAVLVHLTSSGAGFCGVKYTEIEKVIPLRARTQCTLDRPDIIGIKFFIHHQVPAHPVRQIFGFGQFRAAGSGGQAAWIFRFPEFPVH